MTRPKFLTDELIRILFLTLLYLCASRLALSGDGVRTPRVDMNAAGTVTMAFQSASDDGGGYFELFESSADDPEHLVRFGRFHGRLAGVATTSDNQHLALTRDGSLAIYQDDMRPLAFPNSLLDMYALCWWDGRPVAAGHDNGKVVLFTPGEEHSWNKLPGSMDQAGRILRIELLPMKDGLHVFWSGRTGSFSEGTIRHVLVNAEGTWSELPPLALGDVAVFTVYARKGVHPAVTALVPDSLEPHKRSLLSYSFIDGEWRSTPLRPDLFEVVSKQNSFAASGVGSGYYVWLLTGPGGAELYTSSYKRLVLASNSEAMGRQWSSYAGLALFAGLAVLVALYCRRSRMLSALYPARPPDLLSRGAALAADWLLVSLAMGTYHLANGDFRIIPEMLVSGQMKEMFWVNLAALVVFTTLSEGLFGRSPGKQLAALRVRNLQGGPPTFVQAAIRNCFRAVDMFPVAGIPGLAGLLAACLNPMRQRIGDMLAATMVRRHLPLARRRFLLASKSPRRLELLQALGVEVRVLPSEIDETPTPGVNPSETVRGLAQEKARVAAEKVRDGEIVVGADTVVVLDGAILGKPRDVDDAKKMLTRLSGRSHTVFTGVAVWDSATGQGLTDVEETEVEFRNLSDGEISAYIATGDPMDKAGGYGVQTGNLVKQVRGSLSNVAGLPMEKFQNLLELLDS